MTSLRKAAIAVRPMDAIYTDHDRNIFEAAVLEIAHAISRGRKPSSCSLLSGENVQAWLRRMYYDENPYCKDFGGDPCSVATYSEESAAYYYPPNPLDQAVLRAIRICGRYIRPVRKPEDIRGEYLYQDRHKSTNRKKKAEWLSRKNGSHYGDFDDRDWDSLGGLFDLHDERAHDDSDPIHEPIAAPTTPLQFAVTRVRRVRKVSGDTTA